MKGQLNFEFLISIAIFVVVISYVTINSISGLPNLHRESLSNSAKTKLFQISEMLLFDDKIGLSAGEPYVLSASKISTLQSECSTYQNLKDRFSIGPSMDLHIQIKNNGNVILDCRPDIVSQARSEFSLKRYGIVNENIVEMNIRVFA